MAEPERHRRLRRNLYLLVSGGRRTCRPGARAHQTADQCALASASRITVIEWPSLNVTADSAGISTSLLPVAAAPAVPAPAPTRPPISAPLPPPARPPINKPAPAPPPAIFAVRLPLPFTILV